MPVKQQVSNNLYKYIYIMKKNSCEDEFCILGIHKTNKTGVFTLKCSCDAGSYQFVTACCCSCLKQKGLLSSNALPKQMKTLITIMFSLLVLLAKSGSLWFPFLKRGDA
jgi:hypothetical protein